MVAMETKDSGGSVATSDFRRFNSSTKTACLSVATTALFFGGTGTAPSLPMSTPVPAVPTLSYSQPLSEVTMYQKFRTLADQWYDDTAMLSSVNKKAMHPAYQRIIGMGEQALPLILAELQDRPSDWFWALNAISGEEPVKPDSTFREGVALWLEWGKERGYLA